jgi:hypothetical protein
MGWFADTALWVGISIGCLLLGTATVLIWRIRTGPHPLDYPSDEAYYAAKAREAHTAEPGRSGTTPADSGE